MLKEAEEMKETLRSSENQAEWVRIFAASQLEKAEEQLALAKLIRRGADRDLVQALKSVHDLKTQLEASEQKFNVLWDSV